jgi:hypothetical protein
MNFFIPFDQPQTQCARKIHLATEFENWLFQTILVFANISHCGKPWGIAPGTLLRSDVPEYAG